MPMKIIIESDDDRIADSFIKKRATFIEASSVLLRLKQIEQKIVDMDFDDEMKIEDNG